MRILIVASYNKNRYALFIVEQAEALRQAGCENGWYGVQGKGIAGYLKAIIVKRDELREELAKAVKKAVAFEGRTNGQRRIEELQLTNEDVVKRILEIYKEILH